jgi:hypothetical protein
MTSSWVIVEKHTGKAIIEIFDKRIIEFINSEKYEAKAIRQYLAHFNAKIQEQKRRQTVKRLTKVSLQKRPTDLYAPGKGE